MIGDEKRLLGEVRDAITALSSSERRALIERFGLGERLGIVADENGLAASEGGRRWLEIRALRKLRTAGLGLRGGIILPIAGRLREAGRPVVTPLRRQGRENAWPPAQIPISDPWPSDNRLWDEV